MIVSEALAEYLQSRAGQGYAASTLRNNRQHIQRFIDDVGDLNLRGIEPRHVDVFVRSMVRDGWAPASVNISVSDLGAFFRWCRGYSYMRPSADPMANRRPLRVKPKERMRVPLGAFPHLLDSTGSPRDRMVIALGLYLFLRQSEMLTLRVKDVDLQSAEVRVRIHKTNDMDTMPISTELDTELRRWLTYYGSQCGTLQPEWYLVPAMSAPRINRVAGGGYTHTVQVINPDRRMCRVEEVAQRTLVRAGFPVRDPDGRSNWEGIHTLRRSGARALFDELRSQGYDGALRQVQTWLHHKNASTTEGYLGLGLERTQRNDMVKGNPLFPSLTSETKIRRVV